MSRREFPPKVRKLAWEIAKGCCAHCGCYIRVGNGPIYDHRVPDAVGGEPTIQNCQVLCKCCNSLKTFVNDIPQIAKTLRILKKIAKAEAKHSRPMPGSRASNWKHKMSGGWERRNAEND